MEIKVLGAGCSRCKKALDVVNKMEYNVMSTPAVVVDGEVKIKGSVPTEADVRKALGL